MCINLESIYVLCVMYVMCDYINGGTNLQMMLGCKDWFRRGRD